MVSCKLDNDDKRKWQRIKRYNSSSKARQDFLAYLYQKYLCMEIKYLDSFKKST